jgi:hypothetical protein
VVVKIGVLADLILPYPREKGGAMSSIRRITAMIGKQEIEWIEASLANERLEQRADYLSRGRPLEHLDELALKALWVNHLRREFQERTSRMIFGNDICAELSIRGITDTQLPPDLLKIMTEYLQDTFHPIVDRARPPN